MAICFALFQPLYQALAETSKQEKQWNADETSWMSFTQLPGKKNYLTWMWVFVSRKVILYIWDPSRSSRVPLAHLGKLAQGFLTADRYGAYKKLVSMVPGLTIAFCWVHFRRDFIRTALSDKTLEPWAKQWEIRIGEIFQLNKARKEDPALQGDLEKAIDKMEETINAELADPTLKEAQHKVLKSAKKHWEGLTVFVTNPQVPMDNNIAERPLRIVALGRNNYYGNRAEWSSHFTAICLTLVKTARLHGLNPQAYLRYYLKLKSARELLDKLHAAGLIVLPPKQTMRKGPKLKQQTLFLEPALTQKRTLQELLPLSFEQVTAKNKSALWNELIERYHYLGSSKLFGARMRYLVYSQEEIIAALGFSAAAWQIEPRDRFIGWDQYQRRRNLQLIVGSLFYLGSSVKTWLPRSFRK